jgi:hypothetical protein
MSMELWQRLKDLEKKVAEHEAKLKEPIKAPVVVGMVKRLDELELRTPPDAVIRKPGPALCPKCGKAPGYYFHVKWCKGNADVA